MEKELLIKEPTVSQSQMLGTLKKMYGSAADLWESHDILELTIMYLQKEFNLTSDQALKIAVFQLGIEM